MSRTSLPRGEGGRFKSASLDPVSIFTLATNASYYRAAKLADLMEAAYQEHELVRNEAFNTPTPSEIRLREEFLSFAKKGNFTIWNQAAYILSRRNKEGPGARNAQRIAEHKERKARLRTLAAKLKQRRDAKKAVSARAFKLIQEMRTIPLEQPEEFATIVLRNLEIQASGTLWGKPAAINADLRGAYLPRLIWNNVDLTGALFDGAYMHGAKIKAAVYGDEGPSFQGANLRRAELELKSIEEAPKKGVNFNGAELREARLLECDLPNADLRKARFGDALPEGGFANQTLIKHRKAPKVNVRKGAKADAGILLANDMTAFVDQGRLNAITRDLPCGEALLAFAQNGMKPLPNAAPPAANDAGESQKLAADALTAPSAATVSQKVPSAEGQFVEDLFLADDGLRRLSLNSGGAQLGRHEPMQRLSGPKRY